MGLVINKMCSNPSNSVLENLNKITRRISIIGIKIGSIAFGKGGMFCISELSSSFLFSIPDIYFSLSNNIHKYLQQ